MTKKNIKRERHPSTESAIKRFEEEYGPIRKMSKSKFRDSICKAFDITPATWYSRFKKQMNANVNQSAKDVRLEDVPDEFFFNA